MIRSRDLFSPTGAESTGIDRTKLRLAVLGILVVATFVALFSRLWFLQVLASDDFRVLAARNRVRIIRSEPHRGRVLDRNGKILIDNRSSLVVTIEQGTIDQPRLLNKVLNRLSPVLGLEKKEMRAELEDGTVSPYKPVVVAQDVTSRVALRLAENQEDFPGVVIEDRPVRVYPQGKLAPHILGYVGEITAEQLEQDYFRQARPRYEGGDIVGREGVELTYDRFIRGRPEVRRIVVNSAGNPVETSGIDRDGLGSVTQQGEIGNDLVLTLDARIQKITEDALAAGIKAARGSYEAPAGGVVVLDPGTGGVISMATYPTFNPRILADGFSIKDQKKLDGNPGTDADNRRLNRPIQAAVPSGSTFKVATAGAAMATGIADATSYLPCPPSKEYAGTVFNNWTSADFGTMGFARSLEVSCDTFYYELGWQMETAYGPVFGDGTERFQEYLRTAGFGHPTGIDLPGEVAGNVPDEEWCRGLARAGVGCADGWLPGFSVNMSIGQGDVTTSPLQMAVSYAALLNGGRILEPHVAGSVRDFDETASRTVHRFEPQVVEQLPLDATEMAVLKQGLEDVVMGDEGTAAGAFAGFPLDRFPVGGKTGTAQIGSVESGLNYAWFLSYAPADDPQYVVAVYLEKAGHGGESAAPVARQIYEGIFKLDRSTEVDLGRDESR